MPDAKLAEVAGQPRLEDVPPGHALHRIDSPISDGLILANIVRDAGQAQENRVQHASVLSSRAREALESVRGKCDMPNDVGDERPAVPR